MAGPLPLFANVVAVARPALRLGGEWAGWCCAFDPYSGALVTGSEFQGVTTERWASNTLQRRSRGLSAGCCEADNWSTLPVADSGSITLMPGARAGLFWTVQVDMLNTNAWALDEAVSESSWRCESVFDGFGGHSSHKRAGASVVDCPQERTRVVCSFNPKTGAIIAREPVLVWQERCWSVRPSENLPLDAASMASVVSACFGEQKRMPYGSAAFARTHLSLPGGVVVRGWPGMLEICVAASGEANWRKLLLRRSWAGGSRYASVETIGDRQVDPRVMDECDVNEIDE
mmetsp:Transcript_7430/g.12566  ORF Transcript_7430/g.12566 Transcript_7430/m.12566 type:complete len:288 (-) Transcript_7430:300-1163(-)